MNNTQKLDILLRRTRRVEIRLVVIQRICVSMAQYILGGRHDSWVSEREQKILEATTPKWRVSR